MGCDSTGCKGVFAAKLQAGTVPRRVIPVVRGVITSECRSTPQSGMSTVSLPYVTRCDLNFFFNSPVQLAIGSSLMAIQCYSSRGW